VYNYVKWLVAVITGGVQATEETTTKASDQLYTVIIALKNNGQFLGQDFGLLPSYNFFNTLTELQTKVDRMDCQIVATLERITNWQKHYQLYLDDLKKHYDEEQETFNRATRGQK